MDETITPKGRKYKKTSESNRNNSKDSKSVKLGHLTNESHDQFQLESKWRFFNKNPIISNIPIKVVSSSGQVKKHLLNHPDFVQNNPQDTSNIKRISRQNHDHKFTPKYLPISDSTVVYSPYPYTSLYINELQIAKNSTSELNSKNQRKNDQNLVSKISTKIAEFSQPIVSIEAYQLSRYVVKLENGEFFGYNALNEKLDIKSLPFCPGVEDMVNFELEKGWYDFERKWQVWSQVDSEEDYSWVRLSDNAQSVILWSKFGPGESRRASCIETYFREENDHHLESVIEIIIQKDTQNVFVLIKGRKGSRGIKNQIKTGTNRSSFRDSRNSKVKKLMDNSRSNASSLDSRSSSGGLKANTNRTNTSRITDPNKCTYYLNYAGLGAGISTCHSFELNSISNCRKYYLNL